MWKLEGLHDRGLFTLLLKKKTSILNITINAYNLLHVVKELQKLQMQVETFIVKWFWLCSSVFSDLVTFVT